MGGQEKLQGRQGKRFRPAEGGLKVCQNWNLTWGMDKKKGKKG